MRIDRSYCSNQNTWPENHPQCIVVHNTDNFAAGADARAHARAQYQGNFQDMSAPYYVDDGEIAYQAAPHSRGCPVVGVIKDQGSYTITEIRNKSWGRLLSGAGWINCHKAYCFYGGSV